MNTGKERKFLFDSNNFDLPDVEPEPEIVIEPPPMFSLEELGIARDEAFAKGRATGLEEARVSREQYLAEQMEQAVREFRFLIGAETYRAAVYEREAIALTETIFKALYPHFTEREGIEEVKAVISKVLNDQPEQSSIIIELPEGDAEAIQGYFEKVPDLDLSRVTFKSSPNLARASCRMSWKDGGALRDQQVIADEILKTLRHSLGNTQGEQAETDTKTEAEIDDSGPTLAKDTEKDETESDS